MTRGSHIKVRRRLYWHHGIDMGDGTVIHASGEPGRRKAGARIRRSTMSEFLRGGHATAVESEEALQPADVAARAEASLGEGGYSLLWNNCEHFAHWCHTGRVASLQVDRVALVGAALGVALRLGMNAALAQGGIAAISRLLPVAVPLSTHSIPVVCDAFTFGRPRASSRPHEPGPRAHAQREARSMPTSVGGSQRCVESH
jgi:hypothetical protein